MTYLKRTNVQEKKSRTRTLLISFILVVVFLVHYFFPKLYAGLLYPVTTVLWNSESGIVGFLGHTVKLVFSKDSLIKENEKLIQEIASRDTSILLLNSLKDENEALKTAFSRTIKGNDVLGVILSRPPVSPYDSLIIDVGRIDGVGLGNKVYAEGDALVGDIIEVYEHQSKVSLFSTPGRLVSVVVGKDHISTQAMGRGLGNFSINLPVEVGVVQGDIITLPQIRPHTFGIVEKILVDSSDSLQTILFKSAVNINSLNFVQVDRNSK